MIVAIKFAFLVDILVFEKKQSCWSSWRPQLSTDYNNAISTVVPRSRGVSQYTTLHLRSRHVTHPQSGKYSVLTNTLSEKKRTTAADNMQTNVCEVCTVVSEICMQTDTHLSQYCTPLPSTDGWSSLPHFPLKILVDVDWLAVWRSGSVVRRLNKVTLRWARLVLGWVTVFGRVYHIGV